MLKGFGAFGIILDDITGKLSDEVIAFAVIAATTLFVFCLLVLTNKLRRRSKKKHFLPAFTENVPALTDNTHDTAVRGKHADSPASTPPSRTFAKDLVASAQAKGVPVAPLQIVLGSLIEAGIYDEDIPGRLLAGAINWPSCGQSSPVTSFRGPGSRSLARKPWPASIAAISMRQLKC
jgi:hypothetical protein